MTIYFCLYIYIALVAGITYQSALKDRHKRLICTWLIFLFVFLILALRHESMGQDLISWYLGEEVGYLHTYDKIAEASWADAFRETFVNYERGFILYCKLIATVTWGNHQLFLAITALISLVPLVFFIYRQSDTPVLSWLIYLGLPMFPALFSALRQVIAIGICALAFLAMRNRKPIWFVLLVLLAASFHKSALLFLIAYPAYYLKLNAASRSVALLLVLVAFVLRSFLFEVLIKLVRSDAEMDNNNAVTLFLVLLAIYLFCTIFTDESEEQNGLMNIFLIACLCQAFGGVYNLALRVGYYFLLALIPLLPNVIKKLHSTQDRILSTVAVSGCFGLFGLYSIATTVWAEAVPYYFFFQQGPRY